MIEEVQNLDQEIKGVVRNNSKVTSTIANNVGDDPNSFTPFMNMEPNSRMQNMNQVPKCFKFPQANRKQGW